MLDANRLYTFEDFESFISLPENTDRLYELIHGKIVEKIPTQEHDSIVFNIATRFKMYLSQNQIGFVATAQPYRVSTDNYNIRQPDISFYLQAHESVNKRISTSRIPDLVVDIQLPADRIKNLREKAGYLMVHKTHTVWLIYPSKQLVEVVTPENVEYYIIGDLISGEPVLPGFTMKVRDVFEG